jgi:hypothetical protein
VAESEAQALLNPEANKDTLGMSPLWDYFNHRRISRAASDLSIDFKALSSFAKVQYVAPLDELGGIDWPTVHSGRGNRTPYMYDGDIRCADGVYSFFSELLMAVVSKSKWIDLESIWTPNKIRAVALPGRVALLTAGFRFRSAGTMLAVGPGQEREGYYTRNRIRLRFTFDGWETTSTSSRGHLSGIWRCTVVSVIRSIETTGSLLAIEATCLGIGTGFGPYPTVPLIAYRDQTPEQEDVTEDPSLA